MIDFWDTNTIKKTVENDGIIFMLWEIVKMIFNLL